MGTVEKRGLRDRKVAAQSSTRDLPRAGGGGAATPPASLHKAELSFAALYRLMTWLSPAYPIGAFSYSSGIEWAVETGDIATPAMLHDWIAAVIGQGGGLCDAVLLVHAHRAVVAADAVALRRTAELALALAPSKERHLETAAQGRAFMDATRAAWPTPVFESETAILGDISVALPIAVAITCASHDIAVEPAVHCFLHGMAANLVSAGMRLVPLGQSEGQRVLAALEPVVAKTAARALVIPLDQIGGAALRADVASMQHEMQYTRLFRS